MSTFRLPVTRRRFLRETGLTLAAASAAPMLAAPFVSRAMADTKALSIVQWSHFVPAYDKWFDQFAKDWGEKNKIAVTVDHIPVANVAARAAAEASAGAGHDLFGWNGAGGAHLYRKFLIDMGDLVKSVEKKYGKVSTIGQVAGVGMRFVLREIPLDFLVTVGYDFDRESIVFSVVPGAAAASVQSLLGSVLEIIDQPIASPADITNSALVIARELYES